MMLLGKPLGLTWKSLAPGMLLTAAGLALMMLANVQSGDVAQVAGGAHVPSVTSSARIENLHHAAHYWRGIGYAVLAMACWTVFGLMNSAWLKRHTEINATDWANWLGCATGLGALGLWFLTGSEPKTLFSHVSIQYYAIICIVTGVGSAWLATILWNFASQRLSASLCGQLIVSETVFALVYSYALDAQWPGALQVTACVLFLLGILATIKAHDVQRPNAATPQPTAHSQGSP